MCNSKKLLWNWKVYLLCFCAGFFITGCTDDSSEIESLNKRINTEAGIFDIVYNQSFADRFNLSDRNIQILDEGLFAVASEINLINAEYQCLLHFYVDNKISFYRPDHDMNFSAKIKAEDRFIKSYNDSDLQWNANVLDSNLLRVLFRSNSIDHSKSGMASTMYYHQIKQNFLPGLTILTIDFSCGSFSKNDFPAQVWIQKEDYPDYILANDDPSQLQRDKNQIFSIPDKLVEKFLPAHEIISDYKHQLN